jgi:hypothetical protein
MVVTGFSPVELYVERLVKSLLISCGCDFRGVFLQNLHFPDNAPYPAKSLGPSRSIGVFDILMYLLSTT